MAVALGFGLSGCAAPVAAASPVDAQMSYLLAHYDDRNVAEFGQLGGTDCVNFTSQGLLARGWTMNAEWWHSEVSGVQEYGRPWISSTALMNYLAAHPELAEEVSVDGVVVGDLAQFDYKNTGIRNHTGTISRITGEGADRTVFLVQHSDDAAYKPVDSLIASHGGTGTVHYWHLLK